MQAGTIPELRTEDQELQHRLSTRLSDVSYAKHRPRVNSVDYRPEDFMTDRELLSQRLKQYGLCERTVKGDGNCQVCLTSLSGFLEQHNRPIELCRTCHFADMAQSLHKRGMAFHQGKLQHLCCAPQSSLSAFPWP